MPSDLAYDDRPASPRIAIRGLRPPQDRTKVESTRRAGIELQRSHLLWFAISGKSLGKNGHWAATEPIELALPSRAAGVTVRRVWVALGRAHPTIQIQPDAGDEGPPAHFRTDFQTQNLGWAEAAKSSEQATPGGRCDR